MTRLARTEEQAAACELAARGVSFKMPAFAGTGKTTTFVEIARDANAAGRRMLYVVFNTAMAQSARPRLRGLSTVTVTTWHSLAFGDIGKVYGPRLETSSRAIARAIEERFLEEIFAIGNNSRRVADHVYGALIAFANSGDATLDLRHAESPRLVTLARSVWNCMADRADSFPVSHDTYFKLWALSQATTPAPDAGYLRLDQRFDLIGIDESQDSSDVALSALRTQRCQQIFVGDRHQSLYAFRNAVNAMEKVDLPSSPLTQSWRFGAAIAEVANLILDAKCETLRIRPKPDALDTVVREIAEDVSVPDAIIARTNAGVFSAAISAAQAGRAIDIVGGVDKLIGSVLGAYHLYANGESEHSTFKHFDDWDDLRRAARGPRGAEYAPFVRIVELYGSTLPAAAAQIRRAIAPKNALRLGTVHAWKGLEARHVRFADDFSPFCWIDEQTDEIRYSEEEANVFYVAVTRAERILEMRSFAEVLRLSLRLRQTMLGRKIAA